MSSQENIAYAQGDTVSVKQYNGLVDKYRDLSTETNQKMALLQA